MSAEPSSLPQGSVRPEQSARSSPPGALLALEDVHTYIAGSHILQGVTFEVQEGRTTVLLGRNGAGKSTTLRTVMGILPAQRGSIKLQGKELAGRPAHHVARQGAGFVPEDREVFVLLTVDENLRLAQRGGSSLGKEGIEQVYTLFPDLYQARNRSAGALSGGQQQMLAIGRALVNHNRIILVDEPTKGLAPIIVKQLQSIFRSLREAGETILLVEQNLEFARAVGDLFYILDEGRIVHGGNVADITGESEMLRRYVGV
jgi:branched-chain amino acid transport system ATP-binding protein